MGDAIYCIFVLFATYAGTSHPVNNFEVNRTHRNKSLELNVHNRECVRIEMGIKIK